MKKNGDTGAIALTIDFSKTIGTIKDLNGINNGPKSGAAVTQDGIEWRSDETATYRELAIPYVRTHDTEYPDGSDRFIDIHCVFPDFSRDPKDPAAYHFAETDVYIDNIQRAGAKVLYRLGESIAISVSQAKHQFPPENFEKWSEICEHIVSHYNAGWNNGYRYGIEYWEIWNEPDHPRQWQGTLPQYYELYRITARRLKTAFPQIKIGGGVLASASEKSVQAFLDGIAADGSPTPLDFFSWHIYTKQPFEISERANTVRKILDLNGYENTISFLDEWNYVDDWENIDTTWEMIHDPAVAAFYAACMICMQDSPVDGALYYDGTLTENDAQWCGLYTSGGKKLAGYYAFWVFAQMKALRNQSEAILEKDAKLSGVYACAASGKTDGIMLANVGVNPVQIELNSNSEHSNASFFCINAEYPDGRKTYRRFLKRELIDMQPGELLYVALSDEK